MGRHSEGSGSQPSWEGIEGKKDAKISGGTKILDFIRKRYSGVDGQRNEHVKNATEQFKEIQMYKALNMQYEQFITTLKEITGKIKDSSLLEEPIVETTHSSCTEIMSDSDQAVRGSSIANDEMKNKLLTYKLDMLEFYWEVSRALEVRDVVTADEFAKKLRPPDELFEKYPKEQRLLDEVKDPSQSHILHGEHGESSTTQKTNNEFYKHKMYDISNSYGRDTAIDISKLTDNEQNMYREIKENQEIIEVDPFGENTYKWCQRIFNISKQLFDSLNASLDSLTQQNNSEQHKNVLTIMEEMYKNMENYFHGKSVDLKSEENKLKYLKLWHQEFIIKFILDHAKEQELQDIQKELKVKAHEKIKECDNQIREMKDETKKLIKGYDPQSLKRILSRELLGEEEIYKRLVKLQNDIDGSEYRKLQKLLQGTLHEKIKEWDNQIKEMKDEAKKLIKGHDPRKLKGKLLCELLGEEVIYERLEKLQNNINGSEYRKLRKLLQGKDKPAQHTFKQLLAMLQKNKQLTMLDEELKKIKKEEEKSSIEKERLKLEDIKLEELGLRKIRIEEYKNQLDTK